MGTGTTGGEFGYQLFSFLYRLWVGSKARRDSTGSCGDTPPQLAQGGVLAESSAALQPLLGLLRHLPCERPTTSCRSIRLEGVSLFLYNFRCTLTRRLCSLTSSL